MSVYGMFSSLKTQAYTLHSLHSFFKHTPWNKDDHFILIDNEASIHPSLTKAYPEIEILRREERVSFSENCNTVLQEARKRGTDAFLLNNDIIFTKNWTVPLVEAGDVIACPLSNQQLQYERNGWQIEPAMDLREYLGHEKDLDQIVEDHVAKISGVRSVLSLAFFCVRVARKAYEAIGDFDPAFGRCGGEDRDYCVRAALKDIPVVFALQSYVLHFQGKSSWRGTETEAQIKMRNEDYVRHFESKWGKQLLELVIFHKPAVLEDKPELKEKLEAGELKAVVEALKT